MSRNRDRWRKTLFKARDAEEIASDIDVDETVLWLTISQSMLQIQINQLAMDEAEIRRFARRFIVEPLLENQRGGAEAALAEAARWRDAVADFRELVADQAMEIQRLRKALNGAQQ